MDNKEVYFGIAWAVLVLVFVLLYIISKPVQCDNFGCFEASMGSCSPAIFVNEEIEASWNYEVIGDVNGQCIVDVTLLMAKEGDLELREYEGHSMSCSFSKGFAGYPDEDLENCHGILKEDLQGRIINKLHEYLVDNLDDVIQGVKN